MRDVLDKYQVQGVETHPVPRFEGEEDEEEKDEESIKQAQTLCGELLWLAGRTRPDLSYGTGLMNRMIHRRPKMVNRRSPPDAEVPQQHSQPWTEVLASC